MFGEKPLTIGIKVQYAVPIGARRAVARIGFIDVENARQILGTLQIPA